MALTAAARPEDAARVGGAVVDGAEGRRSERDEHARVGADGVRHALAAGQARPDQLKGVGGVDAGAGRAARGAAVAAGRQQAVSGLLLAQAGDDVQAHAGGVAGVDVLASWWTAMFSSRYVRHGVRLPCVEGAETPRLLTAMFSASLAGASLRVVPKTWTRLRMLSGGGVCPHSWTVIMPHAAGAS